MAGSGSTRDHAHEQPSRLRCRGEPNRARCDSGRAADPRAAGVAPAHKWGAGCADDGRARRISLADDRADVRHDRFDQGGPVMSGPFFDAVSSPIMFGGLDSADPLTYKVYQPDRMVMGK